MNITDWEIFFKEKKNNIITALSLRSAEIDISSSEEEEMAQNLQLQTNLNALQQRDRQALNKINSALLRISSGQFGFCQECEEPIVEARLKAIPDCEFCISCAENKEFTQKFIAS